MKCLRLILPVFVAVWFSALGMAMAVPIDPVYAVNNWNIEQAPNYPLMPTIDWGVTNGAMGLPPGVSQVIANSQAGPQTMTGSLISDFVTTEDFQFSGYMRTMDECLNAGSFGIAFGWQDVSDTYYLESRSRSTVGTGIIVESLSVIKKEDGVDTVFAAVSQPWQPYGWYRFVVERGNDELAISILGLDPVVGEVLSTTITDTSHMSGEVGLWASALSAEWGGLDIEPKAAPVPEPATILLLSCGLAGIAAFRKKVMK